MALWYFWGAFVLNYLVGYLAHRKKALKYPSGFIAAGIVGLTIFLASWRVWVVLVTFFITSSVLSKFRENDPIKKKAISFAEKGSERDSVQVFANGGSAFIFSLISLMSSGVDISIATPLMLGAVGSLAASTADTWSTEIGTSSRSDPVLVYKPWKKVPRGTSGGVTLLGTFASLLGALLISLVFYILGASTFTSSLIIMLAGFTGGLIDSLLGGTIQATFSCSVCNKQTERLIHCNKPTIQIGGISWFDNDVVNFIASFSAGILTWLLSSHLI